MLTAAAASPADIPAILGRALVAWLFGAAVVVVLGRWGR